MSQVVIVRTGEAYDKAYVTMIREQVKEFTGQDLIVLGDRHQETTTHPLRNSWPGWWAKMELFAPWHKHLRPFFFIDLDTYILDDIQEMVEFDPGEDLWMLEDFNETGKGQSAIMIIPKEVDHIWNDFVKNPSQFITQYHGDQDFLRNYPMKFLQDKFTGIKSYKVDQLYDDPKGARICAFHGKPKPHTSQGWASKIWERYIGKRDNEGTASKA